MHTIPLSPLLTFFVSTPSQKSAVKKFTKHHDWVQVTKDGVTTFGLTHYGQGKYGDILMVEFKPADKDVKRGGITCSTHRKGDKAFIP